MTQTIADRSVVAESSSLAKPDRAARNRRVIWAKNRAWTVFIAVSVLVLLEVAAQQEWVSRLILPAPSAVWGSLVDGFSSGLYWEHIQSTVFGTLAGFALAAVVGVTIAGILASIPRLENIMLPFIVAFQTIPKIAIAPLIILWLGFGGSSKVVIVMIVCLFPVLVNSLQGLRVRDRSQLELMESLGASRLQMFRYIRFPNALPYIFAGLHVAIIFSLTGAVVAEFVGSRSGLGYLLIQQQAAFNVAGVFAILVLLMIFGIVLNQLTQMIERRVTFWAEDVSITRG